MSDVHSGRVSWRRAVRALGRRALGVRSLGHLYLSCVAGVLIGLLPTDGLRAALVLTATLLLGLNLLAQAVGLAVTLLFPSLHLVAHALGDVLNPGEMSPFSSAYLEPGSAVGSSPDALFFAAGSLLVGFVLSMLLVPLLIVLAERLGPGEPSGPASYVFSDPAGRRAALLRGTQVAVAVLGVAVLASLGSAVIRVPQLPALALAGTPESPAQPASASPGPATPTPAGPYSAGFLGSFAVPTATGRDGGQVFAFHQPWDAAGTASLRQNAGRLDVVVSGWFELGPNLTLAGQGDPVISTFLQEHGIAEYVAIRNLADGTWDAAGIRPLLTSTEVAGRFTREVIARLRTGSFDGVSLDFRALAETDRAAYASFVDRFAQRLHAEGFRLAVVVTAAQAGYDLRALASAADHLLVLLEEHSAAGPAGPLASQGWWEARLDALFGLPRDKTVVVLSNHGYDWNLTRGTAERVTLTEALERARVRGRGIGWDGFAQNPRFHYVDYADRHEVWFLDAATTFNQLNAVAAAGFVHVGLSDLGSVDPSTWPLLSGGATSASLAHVARLSPPEAARFVGEGPVLRALAQPETGSRRLSVRDGFIVDVAYEALPVPRTVARSGGGTEKRIVLTFDDGPDDTFTPAILDILRQQGVPATFFTVGGQALRHRDLLARIHAEGHEIGVHTYTHPLGLQLTDLQFQLELSMTQRIIQDVTGRSTVLFRPPGGVEHANPTNDGLLSVPRAQALGYLTVGESIDPKDWQTPGARAIQDRVLAQLANGSVILLHDGGGDRSQTVAALPGIIQSLRAAGYRFVSVGDLVGRTPEAIMPAVGAGEARDILYASRALEISGEFLAVLGVLVILLTTVGIARFLALMVFALRQDRMTKRGHPAPGATPKVSVVIAAYNEEQVIRRTIDSILASRYPVEEIVVVDDGSKDRTSAVIEEAFGDEPKVVLITRPNGGKASAINRALREARSDVVVALDADTILDPAGIGALVGHFEDPRVAAVSGNVKVGNVHNLITRCQHIEYVIGFNLERRAFDVIDCVTVVPGAMGAWRRDRVVEAGYFREDTLAEDTDLTLTLLSQGHLVKHEARALSYTEAPSDLRGLLKQRYRWVYGTLQCLWKHRERVFAPGHPGLNWLALPSMWVFQFLVPLFTPIIDLIFLAGLATGQFATLAGFYLAYLAMDYVAAFVAFRLDREKPGVLVWLLVQRLVYRVLITYVILKSLLAAIKGIAVPWNKLVRTGRVHVEGVATEAA